MGKMMERPGSTDGLRHVAIFVQNLEETEAFYVGLLGMEVEWRPDDDNVYLTSGNDNLALHRANEPLGSGRLDHIGFFVNQFEMVDIWYEFLKENNIKMFTEPRTHRDGARSFYCADPAGTRIQMIYHLPIARSDGDLE